MINSLAARFSRKCATEDVPGISRMLGARCNNHTSATHRGEASSCAATRVRVADCKGEDWLRPHLDSGALEPILEPWWQRFTGPYLYYHGHRYLPSPLRAFIDFINAGRDAS